MDYQWFNVGLTKFNRTRRNKVNKVITFKQYDSIGKRLQNKSLREYGICFSHTGINESIVQTIDNEYVEIDLIKLGMAKIKYLNKCQDWGTK